MLEEKSVNFNIFRKSENFEQAYVSNLNQTTQNFTFARRQHDSPVLDALISPVAAAAQKMPSKKMIMQKNFNKGVRPSRNVINELNLTTPETPNEKCPETVS